MGMSSFDLVTLQSFFRSSTISSARVDGSGGVNVNYGISAALGGDMDLPGRFDKMAARMTDYLRSGPNSQLARGVRVEPVVYVSIRWAWLLGPAAM
ncbi:hypothetical protein CDD83_32 [Cordyceps sp. RAO-2017]|nr:hypothetical protein CDD83_32 [Cordyceps sp. RAO-2017]